jgi:predicted DNA-binding ribbon-helix-helix protein
LKNLERKIIKRSIRIGNHRTSISIENEFWIELENEAKNQKLSMSKLILRIDNERPKDYNNLSSYIRVWILQKLKS